MICHRFADAAIDIFGMICTISRLVFNIYHVISFLARPSYSQMVRWLRVKMTDIHLPILFTRRSKTHAPPYIDLFDHYLKNVLKL